MLRIIGLLAVGLALSGCATVTRGSDELLAVDSAPSGAEVRSTIWASCGEKACESGRPEDAGMDFGQGMRDGPACVTPCTMPVKRINRMRLTFTKAGHEPQSVEVFGKPAGAGVAGVAGNAIIGGVTGVLVDSATGAALDQCPNPVKVALRPLDRQGRPVGPPPPDPREICNRQPSMEGNVRADM